MSLPSAFRRWTSFLQPQQPFETYNDCLNGVDKMVIAMELFMDQEENKDFVAERDRATLNSLKADLKERQKQAPKLGKWASLFLSGDALEKAQELKAQLDRLDREMRKHVSKTQSQVKTNVAKGLEEAKEKLGEMTQTIMEHNYNSTKHVVKVEKALVHWGAFGAIQVGTCATLGGKVALKRPTNNTLESEDSTQKFIKEGEIWAALVHKHILPFLGTCVHENIPYLISLYVEDAEVYSFLKRNQQASRATLLRNVASALKYLHSDEISMVHGDVKSINMLISRVGHIYLCDFGLTKPSYEQTTHRSRGLGTVCWLSPQRLGREGRSLRTKEDDVYAFGITIAEFLREGHPYGLVDSQESDEMTLADFVLDVVMRGVRPLKGTGTLWDLAERCWTAAITERPTMIEVVEILDDEVLGEQTR